MPNEKYELLKILTPSYKGKKKKKKDVLPLQVCFVYI
jgi:hypothetical protein